MAAEDHLLEIARDIEALEGRFVSSQQLGLYLKAEDAADYKRLAVDRPIASPFQEALLHLVCEFAAYNNALERTVIHRGPRLARERGRCATALLGR